MKDLEQLIAELMAKSAPGRKSGWDKQCTDLIIQHLYGNVDGFVRTHLMMLRTLDYKLRKPE